MPLKLAYRLRCVHSRHAIRDTAHRSTFLEAATVPTPARHLRRRCRVPLSRARRRAHHRGWRSRGLRRCGHQRFSPLPAGGARGTWHRTRGGRLRAADARAPGPCRRGGAADAGAPQRGGGAASARRTAHDRPEPPDRGFARGLRRAPRAAVRAAAADPGRARTRGRGWRAGAARGPHAEEHTSELQSPDTISYAVFCLKKKKKHTNKNCSTLDDMTDTDVIKIDKS